MATRPHSEHSLRAIRSLFKIEEVMMKTPVSEAAEGPDVEAMWISVNAATVFATTWIVVH